MKKTKRKTSKVRINTGDAVVNRLYTAVRDYVEKHKGSAVVIGGISLVDEGRGPFNYGIMVRCTGKRPQFTPSN